MGIPLPVPPLKGFERLVTPIQDWVSTLPCQDLSSGQTVPSGGERLHYKGEPPAKETLCAKPKGASPKLQSGPKATSSGLRFREESVDSASFICSYQQKADGARMVMERQLLLCASCGGISRERRAESSGGWGLSENVGLL